MEPRESIQDEQPPDGDDTGEPAEIGSESEEIEQEGVIADHEGPEPVRIPTSLTAALREQGDTGIRIVFRAHAPEDARRSPV